MSTHAKFLGYGRCGIAKTSWSEPKISTGPRKIGYPINTVFPDTPGQQDYPVGKFPFKQPTLPGLELVDIPRPNRDHIRMEEAKLEALRSTCNRKKVGCIITVEGRIVSTGYAGAPSRLPHCTEAGCEIGPDGGCIRTAHAEQGAIAFAARKGLALEGGVIYLTLSPCRSCTQLIINAGIKKVVYLELYRDTAGLDLLDQAGIPFHMWEEK